MSKNLSEVRVSSNPSHAERDIDRVVRRVRERVEAGSEVRVVLIDEPNTLSPAAAGKLLGVSRQFVDRLIASGRLHAQRLPGSTHRRLTVADVVRFAAEHQARVDAVERAAKAMDKAGVPWEPPKPGKRRQQTPLARSAG